MFAKFIIECYDVKHVIFGQLFRRYSRRNPINYNELIYDVNKQLTEQTGDESKISLCHHRGFWFNSRQYIPADGVHSEQTMTSTTCILSADDIAKAILVQINQDPSGQYSSLRSALNMSPFMFHCRQRAPIENVWSTSEIF